MRFWPWGSIETFWAHLCTLHGGLICVTFCPSVWTWPDWIIIDISESIRGDSMLRVIPKIIQQLKNIACREFILLWWLTHFGSHLSEKMTLKCIRDIWFFGHFVTLLPHYFWMNLKQIIRQGTIAVRAHCQHQIAVLHKWQIPPNSPGFFRIFFYVQY